MVNRCIFIGNLGKDPEIINLQSGKKLAKFSIATSETWTDQSGEKQTKTEWISCVIWGSLADVVEKYLKKGNQVYVAGKHVTNQWEDESGNTRYKVEYHIRELVMLGGKKNESSAPAPQQQTPNPAPASNQSASSDETDDLPF